MEYRRFGQADLIALATGFGAWPIGGARYGTSDDAGAEIAIHAPLEAGITCFDTVPPYGNGRAEELLGRALRDRRKEVTFVSLTGSLWNEARHALGRESHGDRVTQALEASLKRPRTDYLDQYFISWPDLDTSVEETVDTLETRVLTWEMRCIGASLSMGEQVRASATALRAVPLAATQFGFNLSGQRWAASAIAPCAELGAGLMAYGQPARGLGTGSFTAGMNFEATDGRWTGMLRGHPLLAAGNIARNSAVVERVGRIVGQWGGRCRNWRSRGRGAIRSSRRRSLARATRTRLGIVHAPRATISRRTNARRSTQ